ncbi:MAG TPA: hypothetical protein VEK10_03415 [Steroidobacteraceae bacterium]|nr:hypothetical protein [Steroidobacteraceae bacterium]
MRLEPAFLQRRRGASLTSLLLATGASAHAQTAQTPPPASGQAQDSGQTLEQRQFKLPPALAGQLQQAEQKAAEEAVGKILDNELPLRLDASRVYPTLAVLPGGPFKPTPLVLSPADMDSPLPPGDYTIQALAFCMQYSVHRPGAGTAYVLGPLQGKAADAIGTLLWRGTIDMGRDRQQLQGVSWAIQSGLTYAQMPKTYQQVIDSVIPEYKGELSGNFLQQVQQTYQEAAKVTHLPPLEQMLGELGQPGQLAVSAMRQQQILLRTDTSDQLREQTLFRGQESGVYTPVKAEAGPWTERIAHVAYLRFKIVGGNFANNNVLEIRILPAGGASAAQRTHGSNGLLHVAYGAQLVAAPAQSQPSLHALVGGSAGVPEGSPSQVLTPIPNASNPCNLSKDQLYQANLATADDSCSCPPAKWTFCTNTNTPAPGQTPVRTSHVNVYPQMCLGRTVNGILFQPQQLPQNCNQSNTHIYQFVQTTPLTVVNSPSYLSGSCRDSSGNPISRNYGQWYLDACPNGAGNGHLEPEVRVTLNGVAGNLWDDEPSGYLAGAPLQKQFYDYLMCGTQVVEAFTYSVKGSQPPGQQCTTQSGIAKGGQQYSAIRELPVTDSGLRSATCAAMSNLETGAIGDEQVMTAIAQQLNCPHIP